MLSFGCLWLVIFPADKSSSAFLAPGQLRPRRYTLVTGTTSLVLSVPSLGLRQCDTWREGLVAASTLPDSLVSGFSEDTGFRPGGFPSGVVRSGCVPV